MKILIIGGHLTPALAVIDALPKDVEVVYVGRKHALEGDKAVSLEYQAITARNIPFEQIQTGRIQRTFTRHTISSLLKLPQGFFQAYKLIKKIKPDVIVGFGGYVSVPICVAGAIFKIPIILHEQTLEAGLANKQLAKFAEKICISWENSQQFFPKGKTVLTGNPAVASIFEQSSVTKSPKKSLPTLVIVGGSLGSHAINILIEGCLEQLLEKYTIIHQTGDAKTFGDFDRLEKKKSTLPEALQDRYTLIKFIDPQDIISTFASATLVLSRAGMNTVTTLLVLNKPALLIPLPISQNHEQKKNAHFFKEHGLGEVVMQSTLTPTKLFDVIHAMIKQIDQYQNTKDTKELQIHTHAAQQIVDIINYAYENRLKKKK